MRLSLVAAILCCSVKVRGYSFPYVFSVQFMTTGHNHYHDSLNYSCSQLCAQVITIVKGLYQAEITLFQYNNNPPGKYHDYTDFLRGIIKKWKPFWNNYCVCNVCGWVGRSGLEAKYHMINFLMPAYLEWGRMLILFWALLRIQGWQVEICEWWRSPILVLVVFMPVPSLYPKYFPII